VLSSLEFFARREQGKVNIAEPGIIGAPAFAARQIVLAEDNPADVALVRLAGRRQSICSYSICIYPNGIGSRFLAACAQRSAMPGHR
jgi:hypothetical protein